jgi:hypothetical protein
VRYGTRHSGDKSGAYLFLPDGPGRVSAVSKSPVRVVEGRLRAYVEVLQGWNTHRATLLNSPGVDGTSVLVSTLNWFLNKMQDKNKLFTVSFRNSGNFYCHCSQSNIIFGSFRMSFLHVTVVFIV